MEIPTQQQPVSPTVYSMSTTGTIVLLSSFLYFSDLERH